MTMLAILTVCLVGMANLVYGQSSSLEEMKEAVSKAFNEQLQLNNITTNNTENETTITPTTKNESEEFEDAEV